MNSLNHGKCYISNLSWLAMDALSATDNIPPNLFLSWCGDGLYLSQRRIHLPLCKFAITLSTSRLEISTSKQMKEFKAL